MIRRAIRQLVLWAFESPASVVYVVGDPFDTEVNPRKRQERARRIVEETN